MSNYIEIGEVVEAMFKPVDAIKTSIAPHIPKATAEIKSISSPQKMLGIELKWFVLIIIIVAVVLAYFYITNDNSSEKNTDSKLN